MTEEQIHNEELAEKLELTRRTNRRRMAWTSMISQCIVIGISLAFPENAAKVQELIIAHIIASSSVVAAYCGFSAWMSIKK